MTPFMSIRLIRVSILITGLFNMFTLQQSLPWIGLETLDISEQLIKLTLKFSMMLKILNKLLMELLLFSMLLCGIHLPVNSVGKLWEFSHQELMVLISIVLTLLQG